MHWHKHAARKLGKGEGLTWHVVISTQPDTKDSSAHLQLMGLHPPQFNQIRLVGTQWLIYGKYAHLHMHVD